ncbi:phage regulatory protein/antirepressor Ant [Paenibacillus oralis]|uniref:phage regulatory protein/antirepressor Ant n=1 Tax=Paenibacillus oralis TaxID=2490856 RepID=UPI001FEB9744|nr:phage regulatory protein/antirepressor Ant [Paenibacillus oralis]
MNQLTIRNANGKLLADSREVAEMTGKRHDHLIRDIDSYVNILNKATTPDLGASNFFIESSYVDSKGEKRRRYDLTRKGCDMVANKMTGEKGVLFTATYVTRFEEMEHQLIEQTVPSYMIDDPIKRAERWIEERKEHQTLQTKSLMLEQRVAEYEPKISYLDRILQSKGTLTITQIAKDYGMSGQALNQILREEKVQYKQNGQWLLYRQHHAEGYTKSETIDITHRNGDPDTRLNTRWTQKGRLFIHEILTKRGILPVMDRIKQIS